MCLSIPARVTAVDGNTATVDIMGNVREADVTMLPDVVVGDYILLHAGFAIGKYDQADAEETLAMFEQHSAPTDAKGDTPDA